LHGFWPDVIGVSIEGNSWYNRSMANALIKNDGPDKRERISPRLRHALDLMVWGDETGRPLPYDEAAKALNIKTQSMRRSLERSVTRAYLREQREVFRACLTSKTLHRLAELGWQDENRNAAVAAIRAIEGQEEQSRASSAESPFVTIRIINAPNTAPAPVIEHEPQPQHEPQRYDEQGHLLPIFRDPIDRDR
jgi:hypothetical protein